MAIEFHGLDLTNPINRIKAGLCALCANVRAYLRGGFALRNPLSDPIPDAQDAVTSSVNSGTVSQSGSGVAWSNPSNIFSTSSYAQISITGESLSSQLLSITDLGFDIPTGATITGIGFTLQSNRFIAFGVAVQFQWTQNGINAGTPFAFDAGGASTYTISAGGLGQLFGYSWTPALINNLGLNMSTGSGALSFGTIAANLSNLVITVYYTVMGPLSLPDPPHTIRRLNDTTPNGPASGYVLVIGAAGKMYVNNTLVASGLSGNPVSLIPFRPNASVQPWMYVGDSAAMGTVTLYTKYLINGVPVNFPSSGMIKIRSDGLCYKMGIEEPQLAPLVSTANSAVTVIGPLLATAIPWTNYLGANTDYSYGETEGYPNVTPPVDGTAPYIIDVANASFLTINSITGMADVNGGSHAASDTNAAWVVSAVPGYPGQFIQIAGTGAKPGTASVVIGAFMDASGNVIPKGVAPLYVPSVVDVGAVIGVPNGIAVPYGAQTFQIGINSVGNTYSSNSGSYTINATVTTNALPTVTSILGNLTCYYWDDSPINTIIGPYIWKNPDDSGGSGPTRSTSNAVGSTTGNSFIFDATFNYQGSTPPPHTGPGIPGLPGIGSGSLPMMWYQMSPESAVLGSVAIFASPLTVTNKNNTYFTNFNFCLKGNIYFPAGGKYTFVLTSLMDCIWGIGGGVTLVSATASGNVGADVTSLSNDGQTITVVGGYPLLPRQTYDDVTAGGGYEQTTVVVSVPAGGIYPIEIDYNYGVDIFGTGRILLLMCTPLAGQSASAATIIPPLPYSVRQESQYRYTYRSTATGATSNPSPASSAETVPVTSNTITSFWSPDPQVDVVDYYRIDSTTSDYTYVNTGPNDNSGGGTNTPVTDSLTDTELGTQLLDYSNYEPFPSIDLPQKGTLNAAGGVLTWLSGGAIGGSATGFNVRWLAGTTILIGSPTSLAYTLIARPTSTTSMTIPGVPDGTNLAYQIEQPTLAAQPLPYLWGPSDNIPFTLGCGDTLRPGTRYWCAGSNLDAAPDTNQQDDTDPSEALVNGILTGGKSIVFTIKRAIAVFPNSANATATSLGTTGSTWSVRTTGINRGLFIPRCLCVSGGGLVYLRVDDGIHISPNGLASKSITDETLYPLFSHEGSTPTSVTRNGITIYPPDDTQPQLQKFSYQNGYMYWDYYGTDGNFHTLVFDESAMGWIWDSYSTAATIHAADEGESIQGTLVGCVDGTVRQLSSAGTETVTGTVLTPAIGGAGFQHIFKVTVEYSSVGTVALSFIAADEGNGSYAPNALTLPATGGSPTKYTMKVSANKFKWLQMQFQSTDPALQVYLEGFAVAMKAWGSTAEYQTVQPFASSGGEGGEQ